MAKKTRKEKRRADLSRQAGLKNNFVSEELVLPQTPRQKNALLINPVKKDLAKSLILALLVLAFQLVLYWQLK